MPHPNLKVAPDEDDWAPEDYTQPDEDRVTVEHEHPHPLETDQTPTVEKED
ncbi:hypothetical protein [Janibacter sp. GS2]|uniref:hypothetical protein n=1 Tax=Janibacter sp. GS2 TaxID=3442646 RepID=UPI003EBC9D66